MAMIGRSMALSAALALAALCAWAMPPGGPDVPTTRIITVTASAQSVTGGGSVGLTVALEDPATQATTVALSASPASAFTNLPSSVVIPAGHTYVIVTVTTATVSTTVNATVTASATNYTTGTCGVTITP